MSMHFAVMTKTTLWSFLPQVQSADFVCSECGKKYKTRGGYQRHRASKHNPNENDRQERTTLTPSSLAEIVKYAIQTVNRGRAFAPMVRGSTSCNFFFFFCSNIILALSFKNLIFSLFVCLFFTIRRSFKDESWHFRHTRTNCRTESTHSFSTREYEQFILSSS